MTKPALDPHLHRVLDWIDRARPNRLAVIMDPNTEKHCLPVVSPLLPPHTDFLRLSEAGEEIKRIEHAHALWSSLDEAGYDRNSAIIGLGGGTVTDLSAFVASTYLRGVNFWLIPTTLLAMVDAAAGGKTGINLGGAKNRIGTFSHPAGISLSPEFLTSLPPRHLLSGMAEHVKHLLLTHPLEDMPRRMDALPSLDGPLDSDAFAELIRESVDIKDSIVRQDVEETNGIRKQLNLGHTAGHALESWAISEGHDLLHGEAVAWGLGIELAISASRMDQDAPAASMMVSLRAALAERFPCPVSAPPADELWTWAKMDKKNDAEAVRMVLLSEGGEPLVDQTVAFEEFSAACGASRSRPA